MSEIWLTYNGKVLERNGKILLRPETMDIPPMTLRFRFKDKTFVPNNTTNAKVGRWYVVDASNGIYDWTYNNSDWSGAFYFSSYSASEKYLPECDIIGSGDISIVTNASYMFRHAPGGPLIDSAIIDFHNGVTNIKSIFHTTPIKNVALYGTSSITDASYAFEDTSIRSAYIEDASSVTNMKYMFYKCSGITSGSSIVVNNTSNVTDMSYMFSHCVNLESAPTLDTQNVINMDRMFQYCHLKHVPLLDTRSAESMSGTFFYNQIVESGALALYQQASSQANPPTYHGNCFNLCGNSTVTGAAELAQIPADWGGTMS